MLIVVIDDPYDRFRYNRQAYEMPVGGASTASVHSRFRHILTGHIHSQTAIEACGVTVESVQTPIPPDAWHAREGYGGGRSLTSITYHRRYGEMIRNKAQVLPMQEAA